MWQARTTQPDGNSHCIGDYALEEAAARAYDEYALQHRGNGAVRNFPPSTYTGVTALAVVHIVCQSRVHLRHVLSICQTDLLCELSLSNMPYNQLPATPLDDCLWCYACACSQLGQASRRR